jgi:hypothetical protein
MTSPEEHRQLQPVADRIGPTIAEIKTPLPSDARPKFPQETFCTAFLERHAAPEKVHVT